MYRLQLVKSNWRWGYVVILFYLNICFDFNQNETVKCKFDHAILLKNLSWPSITLKLRCKSLPEETLHSLVPVYFSILFLCYYFPLSWHAGNRLVLFQVSSIKLIPASFRALAFYQIVCCLLQGVKGVFQLVYEKKWWGGFIARSKWVRDLLFKMEVFFFSFFFFPSQGSRKTPYRMLHYRGSSTFLKLYHMV